MAPSLSSSPLYIRPAYEKKQIQNHRSALIAERMVEEVEEEEKQEFNELLSMKVDDNNDSNNYDKSMDPNQNDIAQDDSSYVDITCNDDDFTNWIASSQPDQRNVTTPGNNSPSTLASSRDDLHIHTSDKDDGWVDFLNDDGQEPPSVKCDHHYHQLKQQTVEEMKDFTSIKKESKSSKKQHEMMCRQDFMVSAVSKYLQRSIPKENFAYSSQPIRIDTLKFDPANKDSYPTLEVDMIVCGDGPNDSSSIKENIEEEDVDDDVSDESDTDDQGSGKMFVIRMVNHIPLLDSGEASACGIVKGVSEKRNLWNSFGLDVFPLESSLSAKSSQLRKPSAVSRKGSDSSHRTSMLHIPTFALKDNAQVAQYFTSRNHVHSLFEECTDVDDSSCDSYDERLKGKRKKKQSRLLLPAEIRLGKVLLIVQLHAKPIHLPMPTLSKVICSDPITYLYPCIVYSPSHKITLVHILITFRAGYH